LCVGYLVQIWAPATSGMSLKRPLADCARTWSDLGRPSMRWETVVMLAWLTPLSSADGLSLVLSLRSLEHGVLTVIYSVAMSRMRISRLRDAERQTEQLREKLNESDARYAELEQVRVVAKRVYVCMCVCMYYTYMCVYVTYV